MSLQTDAIMQSLLRDFFLPPIGKRSPQAGGAYPSTPHPHATEPKDDTKTLQRSRHSPE